MARIDRDVLSCMDLEWFGVDQKGQLAVFCTAGEANVPEFVCADEEKCYELIELFDMLPAVSETIICFKLCKENHRPIEVAEDFSEKGLFYYDSDDCSRSEKNISTLQKYYTINSKPVLPLHYGDLSDEMQELLKNQFLPVDDFAKCNIVEVKHAY